MEKTVIKKIGILKEFTILFCSSILLFLTLSTFINILSPYLAISLFVASLFNAIVCFIIYNKSSSAKNSWVYPFVVIIQLFLTITFMGTAAIIPDLQKQLTQIAPKLLETGSIESSILIGSIITLSFIVLLSYAITYKPSNQLKKYIGLPNKLLLIADVILLLKLSIHKIDTSFFIAILVGTSLLYLGVIPYPLGLMIISTFLFLRGLLSIVMLSHNTNAKFIKEVSIKTSKLETERKLTIKEIRKIIKGFKLSNKDIKSIKADTLKTEKNQETIISKADNTSEKNGANKVNEITEYNKPNA